MTFKAWIPPAGEVVDPPVHIRANVDVLFSDRSEGRDIAGNLNWSGEGDGPKIIAYSVIEEFVEKREPREWWVVSDLAFRSLWEARNVHAALPPGSPDPVHVRAVLPDPPLDLTKITTPFGLLDAATQAALKAHGGPYELWRGGLWGPVYNEDVFDGWYTYRVAPSAAPAKPAPDRTVDQIIADTGSEINAIFAKAKPAPREVVAWAVVDRNGHAVYHDEEDAQERVDAYGGAVVKLTGYL